jgi:hypothetical protein
MLDWNHSGSAGRAQAGRKNGRLFDGCGFTLQARMKALFLPEAPRHSKNILILRQILKPV